jgi:hypothetical protein
MTARDGLDVALAAVLGSAALLVFGPLSVVAAVVAALRASRGATRR